MRQHSKDTLNKLEDLISSMLMMSSESGGPTLESSIPRSDALAVAHDLKEAGRTLRIIQNLLTSQSTETTKMDAKKIEYFDEALQLIEAASKVCTTALNTISNDHLD